MKRRITIDFSWWRDDDDEVKASHKEALDNSALERIGEERHSGMTSGELLEEVDGISYRGWWSVTTETL